MMFLHGIGAPASSWLPLIMKLIQKASRCILFDLPGHGLSPVAGADFNVVEAYSIAAATILREMEPEEPVTLVGNSLGGAFAMKFLLEHPKQVRSAVLISPAGAPFPVTARDVMKPFLISSLADARAAARKVFVQKGLAVDCMAAPLYQTAIQPCFRALIQSIIAYDDDPDAPVRSQLFTPEMLAGVQVPVQLIWGLKDQVLPPEMRQFYDDHLPADSVRVFPESFGHCPHIETPGEVAGLLRLD